VKKNIIFSLPK